MFKHVFWRRTEVGIDDQRLSNEVSHGIAPVAFVIQRRWLVLRNVQHEIDRTKIDGVREAVLHELDQGYASGPDIRADSVRLLSSDPLRCHIETRSREGACYGPDELPGHTKVAQLDDALPRKQDV